MTVLPSLVYAKEVHRHMSLLADGSVWQETPSIAQALFWQGPVFIFGVAVDVDLALCRITVARLFPCLTKVRLCFHRMCQARLRSCMHAIDY